MHLDTDAYIYKPLCYDPIELFHNHNRSYAYNVRPTDPGWVPLGLWSLVDEYARAHSEIEENLKKNGWTWSDDLESGGGLDTGSRDPPPDYSEFEIVNVKEWKKRREIRAWMEEIRRFPERLYKYGWSAYFTFLRFGRVV